jgi:hypothetical protein
MSSPLDTLFPGNLLAQKMMPLNCWIEVWRGSSSIRHIMVKLYSQMIKTIGNSSTQTAITDSYYALKSKNWQRLSFYSP